MSSELMRNFMIIWVFILPLLFIITVVGALKLSCRCRSKYLIFHLVGTIGSVCLCIAVTAIMLTVWNMNFEEKVAYKISSTDFQQTVEIEKAKEKGKEGIYFVSSFSGGKRKISEAIYNEYIGEGNNAVTLHSEKLELYIATKSFGRNFDTSDVRGIERVRYPWEGSPKPFTEDEITEAVKVLKKNIFAEYWSEATFPFDYTSRFYSQRDSNCLEDGAVKYIQEK